MQAWDSPWIFARILNCPSEKKWDHVYKKSCHLMFPGAEEEEAPGKIRSGVSHCMCVYVCRCVCVSDTHWCVFSCVNAFSPEIKKKSAFSDVWVFRTGGLFYLGGCTDTHIPSFSKQCSVSLLAPSWLVKEKQTHSAPCNALWKSHIPPVGWMQSKSFMNINV